MGRSRIVRCVPFTGSRPLLSRPSRSPATTPTGDVFTCVSRPVAPKGWIFRFGLAGKMRDAGLGAFPTVSLGKARKQAEGYRQLVAAGVDPIEARKEEREAALLASAKAMTFEQCAKAFIASHEAGWQQQRAPPPVARDAWRPMSIPVMGDLPVQAIDTTLVLKVLEPIWSEKPETASRVRGRIEAVLSWAKVRGYRQGENPALWRGHLDQLAARPRARCAGSSTTPRCPIARSAR